MKDSSVRTSIRMFVLSLICLVWTFAHATGPQPPTAAQASDCQNRPSFAQHPMTTDAATGATSLAPGMWWDPTDVGTGWDISEALTYGTYEPTFVVTWLDYDDSGYPVWYFGQSAPPGPSNTVSMNLTYTTWNNSTGAFPTGSANLPVTAGTVTLTMIDHLSAFVSWELYANSGQSAKTGSSCLKTLTDGQDLLGSGLPSNWAGTTSWPGYAGLIVEYLTSPAWFDFTVVMFDRCQTGFTCTGTGRPVWISDGGSNGGTASGTKNMYLSTRYFDSSTNAWIQSAPTFANTINVALPAAGSSGNGSMTPAIDVQPPTSQWSDHRYISWSSPTYTISPVYVAGEITATPSSTCVGSAGQTTCPELVSWRLVDGYPSATAYMVDIGTGTRTQIATNQPDNLKGTYVTLQNGHSYNFELWSTPTTGGGALFATAGPVNALASAGPATPSAPVLASPPADDTVSDGVGSTAGTFSVDQQGNANYAIPVYAPHGRGGLTPSISLNYNSGSGDGLLGFGWNIGGISSITPCRATQEHGDGIGVQRGIGLDPKYGTVYCLDGERMVLTKGPNGTLGAQYRLEHDDQTLIVVESVLANGNNVGYAFDIPNIFAAYSKDGTIRRFGSSAAQLSIADGAHNILTAAWYEYELRDTNGNAATFTYMCPGGLNSTDSTANCSTTPDLSNIRIIAAIVPNKITWIGGEIDFNLQTGGRPAAEQFVTNSLGFPITQRYRISGITVKGIDGSTVRTYTATSGTNSNNTSLRQVTQIKECVGSTCFAPTQFQWDNLNLTSGQFASGNFGSFQGVSAGNVRFADINGDGRTDVVWLDGTSGSFHAALSTPSSSGISFGADLCATSGTCPINGVWGNTLDQFNGAGLSEGTWQLFDFNGDGLADLLYFKRLPDLSYEWEIALSNGSGFPTIVTKILAPDGANLVDTLQYTLMPMPGDRFSNRANTYLADVDGDGLLDLVLVYGVSGGSGIYLLKPTGNTGTGALPYIFQGGQGTGTPYSLVTGGPTNPSYCPVASLTASNLRTADFNGDGRADIVVLQQNACVGDPSGPAPTITGFSTTHAAVGASITINGTNFSPVPAENLVQFNGAPAAVTSVTQDRQHMQVTVPSGATYGFVSLTLPYLAAVFSPMAFTVDGLTGNSPEADASIQYIQILTSKGEHDRSNFYFTAGAYWPLGATPAGGPIRPLKPSLFQVADLNGDGFADVVFAALDTTANHNSGQWYYQIGGSPPACVIANCPQTYGANQVLIGDYDGDGRSDFWLPDTADSANNYRYKVYEYAANGFIGPIISPLFASDVRETADNPTRFTSQIDLDGDGHADTFMHDTGNGNWQTMRLNTGAHHFTGNVISAITSSKGAAAGTGAITSIDYSPLTFSSLYYRETNGPTLASGWGAPVQDVVTPRYAVQYVDSSAPTAANPGATSRVRYRYGGYKVQGFGRGPLGFRQLFTTDMQTNIETVTTYNQAFPLTGTPTTTASYALSSADTSDACSPSPDATACMAYSNPAPTFTGMQALTLTTDVWSYHVRGKTQLNTGVPASAAPINIWNTSSQSTNRGLDGWLLKASAVTRTYDISGAGESYGDLVTSTVGDYTGAFTTSALLRQTVVQNTYADVVTSPNGGNNYIATWYLGRLATSKTTVTPWSNGVANTANAITRNSEFKYHAVTGQLTEEHLQPTHPAIQGTVAGTADQALDKYHFYDAYGNELETVTCSETAACSPSSALTAAGMMFDKDDPNWAQRYSRATFDASGIFSAGIYPNTTYAPFSNGGTGAVEYPTTSVLQRDVFGNVKDSVDVHNVETKSYFGVMGRLYFTATSTGGASQTIYRWCANHQPTGVVTTAPCPASATYVVHTLNNAGGTARAPETWVYYDMLGREVLKVQQGFATGQYTAALKAYDNLGRLAQASEPYFTYAPTSSNVGSPNGVSMYSTFTNYDKLGRVASITHPNSSQTTTSYFGPNNSVTLPANASNYAEGRTQSKNLLSQTVNVFDDAGSMLSNTYDASGNVLTASRIPNSTGISLTATMTYDLLGRKKSLNDPDMGSWTYAYNPLGELVQQASGATCTNIRYDGQGRVWKKQIFANATCTGSPDVNLSSSYDTAQYGIGGLTLANSTDNGVSETRTPQYDSFGRVKRVDSVIGSSSYAERTTYDQFGRVYQAFFSGAGLPETGELYLYNAQGYSYQVQDGENGLIGFPYRKVLTMDQRGNATSEMRAGISTLTTTRGYDPIMGWLTSISTNEGLIQSLSYAYDNLGNLSGRSDFSNGASLSETFGYDILQRLRTQAGTTTANWDYDDIGNITTSGTYGTKGSRCTAANEVTPGPDALSVAAGTSTQYCYDARGNQMRVVSSGGVQLESHSFSADDKLRQTQTTNGCAAQTTTWYYGPDRERIQRTDGTLVTHYVGNAEIIGVGTSTPTIKRYLPGVILSQTGSGVTYEFLFTDSLGSTHRITDFNGNQFSNGAERFTAFGQRANTATDAPLTGAAQCLFNDNLTHHGFTGAEQMDEAGLVHMNGRVYNPLAGRFISADPFIQDTNDLQAYNRYSYVLNNPLVHTDPSGYWGKKQQGYVRLAAAIAITVMSSGAAAGTVGAAEGTSFSTAFAAASTGAQQAAVAQIVMGGYLSGFVASGNLKGAVMGALSAGVGVGIGGLVTNPYANVAANATAGGVLEQLSGGNFGHGFFSAGLSATLNPAIPQFVGTNPYVDGVAAAVVGGTISQATGGKFANGAITAAFSFAFSSIGGSSEQGSDERERMSAALEFDPDSARAQLFPPILGLFAEPPIAPLEEIAPPLAPRTIRPPFESYPTDPAKPPGAGWEWRGQPGSSPGDSNGNWYNPKTKESLRPDLEHPKPIGPHYDYRAPDKGSWYRWYPNGDMELKA